MRTRLFALAALSTILIPLSLANAFVVQHTSEGQEIRWYSSEVTYYINTSGFSDFAKDEVQGLTDLCFQAWESEDLEVHFVYGGEVDVKAAEYDDYNVIYFIQDPELWDATFPSSSTALAMARTQADSGSGAIVGFDIGFNDAMYNFTNTDDPDLAGIDFRNTLTHEIGHILGLDHSEDPDAVMYATSPVGDLSNRVLSADDRDAIAYLYRERDEAPGCGLGLSAPTGAQGATGLLLPLALGPLWLVRRRRAPRD